ncbi:hypothetical protein DSO57_1000878 [Entomophthora muscae]|uniref:Uncharacterized protein n=1 Tax=Entomophthora muscae TaxID=34485 RepID=A0ACC2SYN9_9FUNG|nr:hypothetical protein DSO57_1000878 [Entomophthora muscae]
MYNYIAYSFVTRPLTLNSRVTRACPRVFDTSYRPLVTTKEPAAPVVYPIINDNSAFKKDLYSTESCLINKLSPATTKQTSAATARAPATNKQIHAATTWKSATTKLSPTVNVQTPATTKQTSTATTQVPAAIKQLHTATTQKPTITKLLPTANTQMPTTIEQMHIATVQAPTTLTSPICKPSANQALMSQSAFCQPPTSLYPPMPAGQSPSTPLGNSQIRKQGRDFPQSQTWKELRPNLGAYQMGNELTGSPTMKTMHQI